MKEYRVDSIEISLSLSLDLFSNTTKSEKHTEFSFDTKTQSSS